MPLLSSVPNVPTYEEFYGLIDNELTDKEFDSDIQDEDIRRMVVLALSLLQDFYLQVQYYTAYDILTENFQKELDAFNIELKESLMILFQEYLNNLEVDFNLKYEIPAGTVKHNFDLKNIIDSSVDAVTGTLYLDLKSKADFYNDVAISTGVFSLHADFRRAVKKLTNKIDGNAQYAQKRVDRSFKEFVYGQDALFYWICSGRNTCAWCYEIEAMSPMPLSMLPVDHPNGMCRTEPVNPDQYTDAYRIIRGWI